jgi:phage anti-repressor protein/predicted GIY-YIG superfamily endonuclease
MENLDEIFEKKIDDVNFVKQFKKYLYTDEMISYSDVKDWIGYKYKKSIMENLENEKFGYILGTDYKIVKEKKEGVCKPVNEIYMSIDTIKCICLTAPTELSQKFRRYYIEMEKIYKEYIINLEGRLKNPISCLAKYEFDINQWLKKKVVYLIYIKDNLYKFGITCDVSTRFSTHRKTLNYNYVMKCWDCFNLANAKKIEDELKRYLRCNKLLISYEKQTEIFTANTQEELNVIINKINEFYKKHYIIPTKESKIDEELNKKLEKEDKEINYSNRELVLIDKYNKKYNLNLNKELMEEIKQDIKNLMKVEGELYSDSEKTQNKALKEEPQIEQKEIIVKCTKCPKTQKQEDFGRKEDGSYYKRCDSCLEKSRQVEERRVRKPMTEEQKKQKYSLRKEKRILDKLNNPKEQVIKQSKEEKLEKKKIYYEENKEEIRTKYANRMESEEAKQKERDRKKNYYWQNHDKLIDRNRAYYQKIKIKKDNIEE